MYVNCFDGEKLFLWKFVILTLCLVPTRLKTLFYLFLNSKLIVSIFGLFQSLELIKYMLYLCWVLVSRFKPLLLVHPLNDTSTLKPSSTLIYITYENNERQKIWINILVASVTNLVIIYLQLLPSTQCTIMPYFTY